MKDKERCKWVEDFANDHSVAKGGHIKVSYNEHFTQYKPVDGYSGFKFEDGEYLGRQVEGAASFMFWIARNGYKISKPRKKNK